MPEAMTDADLSALRQAKLLLTSPGLAATLTDALGAGLERGLKRLPAHYAVVVDKAVGAALGKAMDAALFSLGKKPRRRSLELPHLAAACAVGAAGGFFGWAALPVELPASTVVMLRAIADVAAGCGEDLARPEARLACLEVFALGGSGKGDDAAETGYYLVRGSLAAYVRAAAGYLGGAGAADAAAPALTRFLAKIAGRFGTAVTDKLAASAIPVLGAAGAAAVNGVFTRHFQNMARGHFTIRRLERRYGEETVRRAYEAADLD